jgi:hypothetical protein
VAFCGEEPAGLGDGWVDSAGGGGKELVMSLTLVAIGEQFRSASKFPCTFSVRPSRLSGKVLAAVKSIGSKMVLALKGITTTRGGRREQRFDEV